MLKVGIIGATGYVGAELIRLLLNHSKVTIEAISSISYEGEEISSIYKNFYGVTNLICENQEEVIEKCDVIFAALPHGLSEEIAELVNKNNKILIDLGADFRLNNEYEYERWYGKKFLYKNLHKSSIYALPEHNREKIKEHKIIANPGCYPTSIELGLMPLLKNSLIKLDNIICDSKSGATGAGRGLTLKSHYAELNENFSPYGIGSHRHIPEIEQCLSDIAEEEVKITFTPHLLPINRGILSTIYCTPNKEVNIKEIHKLYCDFYKNESFINVLELGDIASIKDVKYTNNCNISLHLNHRDDGLIIVSTIDNMIKGAAGQAIQNMNIILGLKETEGLKLVATCN
ncbi:N-acetyl-gamma-glutamyl-phosphate reductase [Clostridium sp. C8]|uniref:N-acetyl-gamma-glutamyl-phosphate reductase n=1 Tax=Clostridium sp. C8 TaxID=1667357 RepID=UPI00062E57F8|nr:N-acetyl-gamma-glutamyl-phosphate reductase [Clostridium sp. C8]KLE14870.1 N-acetyl-gamma-glutamyl-phosphate reductase [Clostridium sp. C8]